MMLRIVLAFIISLLVFFMLYNAVLKKDDTKTKVSERLKFDDDDQDEDKNKQHKNAPLRRANRKMEDIPFVERVILPIKQSVSGFVVKFAPSSIKHFIEHHLLLAGKPARAGSVGSFLLRMLFFAALVGGATFWYTYGGDMPAIRKITMTIFGTVIGAAVPVFSLRSQISNRQDEIGRQLPEVLDLLVVSVEAGLSFDAALRRIVSRMHGPFIDECKKMLDDMRMGVTKRMALLGMSERCGVQDVALFVTSVVQAERLGSNMSGILKAQSDNVRDRRRQYIRAQALKAPVKIVIPLVMFILPAIFIVALAPPLFSVAENLFK